MEKCEHDRYVVLVRWYMDQYESVVGGDSTAYSRMYHCYRLLELYNDTSDLEKLLEESKSLPISYDALCLLFKRYLKYVRSTNQWPEALMPWMNDLLEGKIERPKQPHRKGQQPGENTLDVGRWEAGRDYVVACLVDSLTRMGIKPTDAFEIVSTVYLMGVSNIRRCYYHFKQKTEGKARAQIPDLFGLFYCRKIKFKSR